MNDKIRFRNVENPEELDVLKGKSSVFQDLTYDYEVEGLEEKNETIEFLKKNFNDPKSLYIFAEKYSQFVGFVAMDTEWREEKSFFIREIFIDPLYQNQKIGQKFFEKCFDHARKNLGKIIVTQTDFKNIPMQKLCERFGFQKWENNEWKEGITYRIEI